MARLTHTPDRARAPRRWPRRYLAALLLPLALIGAGQCARIAPTGSGLLQFSGYADSRAWSEPQALGVNRLFNWSDLEPQDGVYDWAEFDDLLRIAHDSGKRLAPRVYTNVGTFGQATPDWVFDEGAAWYQSDEGDSPRQPVPTDPVFTQKFAEFLVAMGQRYDGDRNIEFFQTNAGMGGFGEMVWGYPESQRPPGWSPTVQIATTQQWIDMWRRAFPTTHLALMENFIGYHIAETVSAYAVDHGFYLQANSPYQAPESQAILAAYAHRTRIILEVEDAGCRTATGDAFDEMTATVFDYGFPVDYLTVCGESFDDPARIRAAYDRLRHGGPGG